MIQYGREGGHLQPTLGSHFNISNIRFWIFWSNLASVPGSAAELYILESTVWQTLRQGLLYLPLPVLFCEWVLRQHQLTNFTTKIVVIDEAIFIRNGIHNIYNTHYWTLKDL